MVALTHNGRRSVTADHRMQGTIDAKAEQKADMFARRLAIVIAAATSVVYISGFFYGPRSTEIALPGGLCAIAEGSFVYVGNREKDRCRWLISTESHGWVATELHNHSLLMRTSWNAAQIKFDDQLFEIGQFHERKPNSATRIYRRPPGA
jgi:hypothetical protein